MCASRTSQTHSDHSLTRCAAVARSAPAVVPFRMPVTANVSRAPTHISTCPHHAHAPSDGRRWPAACPGTSNKAQNAELHILTSSTDPARPPYRCPVRDVSPAVSPPPSSASPSCGAVVLRPLSSTPGLPSAGDPARARFLRSSGAYRLVVRGSISQTCSAPICTSTEVRSICTTHLFGTDASLRIGGEGQGMTVCGVEVVWGRGSGQCRASGRGRERKFVRHAADAGG